MELYSENEPIQTQSYDLNSVLTSTFFRMFLGLLASAIAAAYTYYSGLYVSILSGSTFGILLFTELAVVFIFCICISKRIYSFCYFCSISNTVYCICLCWYCGIVRSSCLYWKKYNKRYF